MMNDCNNYREPLIEKVGEFGKVNPDVLRVLGTNDDAAIKSDRLGPKIHELITLAVAVSARFDGCISVCTKKAVGHGASLDEISEALDLAIASTSVLH